MKDTEKPVKVKVDQMVLMSPSCEKHQEFSTRPFAVIHESPFLMGTG